MITTKKSAAFWLMMLSLISVIQTANASLLDDSNSIFNWAEGQYPQIFSPSGQPTLSADIWYYRYYPSSQTYLGVNKQSEVYVMGGQFGNTPQKVGLVSDYIAQANAANNNNSGNNSPGNGNCVSLPFPSSGLQANYSVTSGVNSGNIAVTYTSTSNTQAVSETSSSFSGGAAASNSTTTTTQNYNIVNNYLYVDSVETQVATSVSGLGSFNDTTNTTFSPAHNEGPALKYCEQQSWISEAVSETTTTVSFGIPGGAITNNTEVVNGLVEAINESLTTPAGTFSTVRIKETSSGEDTLSWYSIELGIFVKVQTFNSAGTMTAETQLTSTN